jgi:hypothetical protein
MATTISRGTGAPNGDQTTAWVNRYAQPEMESREDYACPDLRSIYRGLVFLLSGRNVSIGSDVLFSRADRPRAHEAQLKPVLEQLEDDLAEESPLQKVEKILVGLSAPHWGHFNSLPSSPIFCKASNL